MKVVAAALLCVVLAACTRRGPPAGAAGPVEAVQAFAAAVEKGNLSAAWALLSARTQREASAIAQAQGQLDGGDGAEAGKKMLFAAALPGGKITAREAAQDGGTADIAVTDASGRVRSFRAVREGGLWKVDLDLR